MKTSCLTAVALATLAGTIALAQPARDTKPATQPATPAKPAAPAAKPTTPPGKDAAPHGQPQLPPGWTEADMQACMAAGTPGEQHQHLAQSVGTWQGKCKMWMTSTVTEPMASECTTIISPIMDGRFVKIETAGEMPGMGPFNGFGINGYDNVSKEFQATWIDNCGTGIMTGTGELSSDGKTMTWNFDYHCPITKKPTTWRQVERQTGKDAMVLEMYGHDPKNANKEYKVMEITYTRTSTAVVPTRN